MSKDAYKDFTKRFGLLIKKHPTLITMTLSNIFTMRLIGNKTHGDLAEIKSDIARLKQANGINA